MQGTAAAAYANNCRLVLPATLGRAIAVSGAGAGLTSRALGQSLGEEAHTMLLTELVAHTHAVHGPTSPSASGLGSVAEVPFGGAQPVAFGSTDSTGGGTPFNVMQPTAFQNVMIRL